MFKILRGIIYDYSFAKIDNQSDRNVKIRNGKILIQRQQISYLLQILLSKIIIRNFDRMNPNDHQINDHHKNETVEKNNHLDTHDDLEISEETEKFATRILTLSTPGELYGVFSAFPKKSIKALRAIFIYCQIGTTEAKYHLAKNFQMLMKRVIQYKSQLAAYMGGGIASIGEFLHLIQSDNDLQNAIETQRHIKINDIKTASDHSIKETTEITDKMKLVKYISTLASTKKQQALQALFLKCSELINTENGNEMVKDLFRGYFLDGMDVFDEEQRRWSAICLVSMLNPAASLIKKGGTHKLKPLLILLANDDDLVREIGRISKRGMAAVATFKTLSKNKN